MLMETKWLNIMEVMVVEISCSKEGLTDLCLSIFEELHHVIHAERWVGKLN